MIDNNWVELHKGKFYEAKEPNDLKIDGNDNFTLTFESLDFKFVSIKDKNDFQNEIEIGGDFQNLVMSVRGVNELDERFSFTNQNTVHWFSWARKGLDFIGLGWLNDIFHLFIKLVIAFVVLFFLSIIIKWIINILGIYSRSGFTPALILFFSLSKLYI